MIDTVTQIPDLRRFIIDEIFRAAGFPPRGWQRQWLGNLFWFPANRFAQLASTFDEQVRQHGICSAARWAIPGLVEQVEAVNVEAIPSQGPLLIASNHPGTVDALCIAAQLPREDLKIVASGVPFLRHLSVTRSNLVYSSLDTLDRMNVIRSSVRHLQDGGAVLIFPSGRVDPDPAILPGAQAALQRWSRSLEILIRKTDGVQVLTAIVSGVISVDCLRHPMTHLRRTPGDRQKLGEFIQVIRQMVLGSRLGLSPRVVFGRLRSATELQKEPGILPNLIADAEAIL